MTINNQLVPYHLQKQHLHQFWQQQGTARDLSNKSQENQLPVWRRLNKPQKINTGNRQNKVGTQSSPSIALWIFSHKKTATHLTHTFAPRNQRSNCPYAYFELNIYFAVFYTFLWYFCISWWFIFECSATLHITLFTTIPHQELKIRFRNWLPCQMFPLNYCQMMNIWCSGTCILNP